MKKKIVIILVSLVLIVLTGCSSNTPEAVAEKFCKGMQNLDLLEMEKYTVKGQGEELDIDSSVFNYMKEQAAAIEYKVHKAEIKSESEAEVQVDLKYHDASEVLASAFRGFIDEYRAAKVAGSPLSEEHQYELLDNCVQKATETLLPPEVSVTGTIYFTKVEGNWLIQDTSSDFSTATTSNYENAYSILLGN